MSPISRQAQVCKQVSGFTLTEILISVSLLAIIFVSITETFLVMNRTSARSRVGTAAMVEAQEEIDQVMSARPYTAGTNIPQILRVQSEGGVLAPGESWASATMVMRPVELLIAENNGTGLVKGMLLRNITIINPSLRQVDVVVGYNYRKGTNAMTYTYVSQAQFETDYRYQVRNSTFRSPDE